MTETYNQYLTLDSLRREIARTTGRYDLVTIVDDNGDDYYCNNGIDFYIHQGQRALERRLNIFPTKAKWYTDLTVGTYKAEIANLRSVQEVWILSSDGRDKLIKYDHWDFDEETRTKAFDSATQGLPTHYYPTGLRLSDVDQGEGYVSSTTYGESHQDTWDIYNDNDPKKKGVIVWPPVDQTYTLEVIGLYYDEFPQDTCPDGGGEPQLIEGSEEGIRMGGFVQYSNYWMQEYPNLLIAATIQQIEYHTRGSKASRRWDDIIEREVKNIEMDAIEEEVANVTKMLG